MPLPDPDITPQQRVAAFRQIEAASVNDPDPVIRKRCSEILDLMRGKQRKQLLLAQAAVAQDTNAATDDRLRALDVIYQLIRQ